MIDHLSEQITGGATDPERRENGIPGREVWKRGVAEEGKCCAKTTREQGDQESTCTGSSAKWLCKHLYILCQKKLRTKLQAIRSGWGSFKQNDGELHFRT